VFVNGRAYTYGPVSAAPPTISARFLSEEERLRIADLHRLGRSIRAIARKMGRAASTISRELRRNADPAGGGRLLGRPASRRRSCRTPNPVRRGVIRGLHLT
jgi:transposase, IS30 family